MTERTRSREGAKQDVGTSASKVFSRVFSRHRAFAISVLLAVGTLGCEKPGPPTLVEYPSGPIASVIVPSGFKADVKALPGQLAADRQSKGIFIQLNIGGAAESRLRGLIRKLPADFSPPRYEINGFVWELLPVEGAAGADFAAATDADGTSILLVGRGDWGDQDVLQFLSGVKKR